ncbi:hypothetical protein [Aliiglaciecola sp. LCG003]|uniref:hypothetical protein n=1 Tax=Aliiglaciecola sp. LCG003 TaxID=3053655 RepID=UPI002573350C|nr:hypothetical protein [Aliiglaciecola sp. LCG003]WJG08121.1 hypothetical protein QR722_12300 [Aliiglaciecola sp. LCG003]
MQRSLAMGLLVLIVGLLQFVVSIRAMAQSDIIAEMDQDEDGMISIREAVANPTLLASFGKIDTDGDGKISHQELSQSTLLTQVELEH